MGYASKNAADQDTQIDNQQQANQSFRNSISTPEGLAAYQDQMANQRQHLIDTYGMDPAGDYGGGGFLDFLGKVADPIMSAGIAATPAILAAGLGGAAMGAFGTGGAAAASSATTPALDLSAIGLGNGLAPVMPSAAGAAVAGTGGAAAGAAGTGLGSLLGTVGGNALSSMGVTAAKNLITGQPITNGLLQSGLFSGLGTAASGMGGNLISDGLGSIGLTPDQVASLKAPVTSGLLSAGTSLAKGQGLDGALLNGLASGATTFGGQTLNDYLKGTDLSQPTQQILNSAGKGAISSTLHGNNPLTGAIGGAASGAFGAGKTALLGDNSNNSGATMPDSSGSDLSGSDLPSNDWLSSLYSNLPSQAPYNSDFTNYGANYHPGSTSGLDLSNPFGDIPGYNGGYTFDGSDLSNALGDGIDTTSSSDPGSGSSGGGFLDNLLKQLGNVGTKASQNPLAAIAAGLGALGTVRNALGMTPTDVGKVTDMLSAHAAAGAPIAGKIGGGIRAPVAKNPAAMIQQYAGPLTRIGG